MSGKMIPVEESFAALAQGPRIREGVQCRRGGVRARGGDDRAARLCRSYAAAAGRTHAHDAGGDCAARKRQGKAVDAHARTARRRDWPAAADFLRADARIAFISVPKRLPPSPKVLASGGFTTGSRILRN